MKVKQGLFPPLDNNCYLLVDEATNCSALIDCSCWDRRMEALIGDTDLQYILLTHGHFDHIGGIGAVKEKYGAKIVISNEDAPMLSSPAKSLAAFSGFRKQEAILPDITVDEGDTIQVGGITVSVLKTPGHTVGGVCYLAEDCLFTGDTLFCESCGRTDFPGGSMQQIIQSLHRLAALEGDYAVFPGHGETTTLSHERQYNPYMRDLCY